MQRCIDRLSRGYNPFSIGTGSLRLPTNINDKSFSCFFLKVRLAWESLLKKSKNVTKKCMLKKSERCIIFFVCRN